MGWANLAILDQSRVLRRPTDDSAMPGRYCNVFNNLWSSKVCYITLRWQRTTVTRNLARSVCDSQASYRESYVFGTLPEAGSSNLAHISVTMESKLTGWKNYSQDMERRAVPLQKLSFYW